MPDGTELVATRITESNKYALYFSNYIGTLDSTYIPLIVKLNK